ncbi:MAG: protein TolR [Parvularculaceae bacterium]
MVGVVNGSTGGGRHRPGRPRPMAEINVTPLVDVMLVLLIVFMVAAPLLTVGVAVDLPETAADPIQDQGEPLTVTITADGVIYVQETAVDIDSLVPHLEAIAVAGYDQRIFIRGDQSRSYGDIVRVMGRINAAGFRRIGLVTDPELS